MVIFLHVAGILLHIFFLLNVCEAESFVKDGTLHETSNSVVSTSARDVDASFPPIQRSKRTAPVSATSTGSIFTDSVAKGILDLHNKLRAQVGASDMEFMVWNNVLANSAQQWAEGCAFFHGFPVRNDIPFPQLGQNLYITSGNFLDPLFGTQLWFNETQYYDYDTMKCTEKCGHYTQVVWSTSFALGCGLAHCTPLLLDAGVTLPSGNHFVCHYGPNGNWKGLHPFQKGPPCTGCQYGQFNCFNDLYCRNITECKASGANCPCKESACYNCGTITSDCKCICRDGFTGLNCTSKCINYHEYCNAVPGWPPTWCDRDFVIQQCPLMCNVCRPLPADPPVCFSSSTAQITSSTEFAASSLSTTNGGSDSSSQTTTKASKTLTTSFDQPHIAIQQDQLQGNHSTQEPELLLVKPELKNHKMLIIIVLSSFFAAILLCIILLVAFESRLPRGLQYSTYIRQNVDRPENAAELQMHPVQRWDLLTTDDRAQINRDGPNRATQKNEETPLETLDESDDDEDNNDDENAQKEKTSNAKRQLRSKKAIELKEKEHGNNSPDANDESPSNNISGVKGGKIIQPGHVQNKTGKVDTLGDKSLATNPKDIKEVHRKIHLGERIQTSQNTDANELQRTSKIHTKEKNQARKYADNELSQTIKNTREKGQAFKNTDSELPQTSKIHPKGNEQAIKQNKNTDELPQTSKVHTTSDSVHKLNNVQVSSTETVETNAPRGENPVVKERSSYHGEVKLHQSASGPKASDA